MTKREHTAIMTKIVEEAGKCELCGSKRGLEAHHIIPVVCGGTDEDKNLICVCQCCHARLTPRGLLTHMGIKKTMHQNDVNMLKVKIFDAIESKVLSGADPFDAVQEAILEIDF